MEAKKKAIEIYNNMLNETFAHNDINECNHTAKQCALIAVDLAIEYNDFHLDFLYNIKTEVEKL